MAHTICTNVAIIDLRCRSLLLNWANSLRLVFRQSQKSYPAAWLHCKSHYNVYGLLQSDHFGEVFKMLWPSLYDILVVSPYRICFTLLLTKVNSPYQGFRNLSNNHLFKFMLLNVFKETRNCPSKPIFAILLGSVWYRQQVTTTSHITTERSTVVSSLKVFVANFLSSVDMDRLHNI